MGRLLEDSLLVITTLPVRKKVCLVQFQLVLAVGKNLDYSLVQFLQVGLHRPSLHQGRTERK